MNVSCTPEYRGKRNLTNVDIGRVRLFFSYQTLVGFVCSPTAVCIENLWGPTTGKHLNLIGFPRVPQAEFERLYNETAARVLAGKKAKLQPEQVRLI